MKDLQMKFDIDPKHTEGLQLIEDELNKELANMEAKAVEFMEKYGDGIPPEWAEMSRTDRVFSFPRHMLAVLAKYQAEDRTEELMSANQELMDGHLRITYLVVSQQQAELVVIESALAELDSDIAEFEAQEDKSEEQQAKLVELKIAAAAIRPRVEELRESANITAELHNQATTIKGVLDKIRN